MDIFIKESKIQFKSPITGQPTRACAEHYNGRRVLAMVDGEEKMIRFKKEDIELDVNEDEIINTIAEKSDA